MTREELLQDLAYARTLAEEGRNAPLLGGAHLLFWGVLNAAAFTAHWMLLQGYANQFGGSAFGVLWMSYGVFAGIGMGWLRMHTRNKPGLTTIGARAERALWSGVGLGLIAVVIGSIARLLLDQDTSAPNAILGAAFALYGAALFGVSMLTDQSWLRAFAWLSVVIAAVLCVFANEPWAYLIAAAGALAVLAWPGVVLMKREPSAIV